MKTFKALVKETYIYEIEIEADTKEQALKKVKEIYDNVVLDTESEYRFTADANSHVDTMFMICEDPREVER